MEALLLAVPHWLTELVFRVSVFALIVAFVAVVVRAFVEFHAPVIEDEDEDEEILEDDGRRIGAGLMTQAEFDAAYRVQR